MISASTIKPWLITATPQRLKHYWALLEGSPVGQRLVRGAFWSLAGAAISRGLALVSSIIVARLLGKVGFGELGMIQSTIGMFATFAGFGLGMTATKYVAELRASDPLRAGRIIGMSSAAAWATGILMTLILLGTAEWLASTTLKAPALALPLRIASALLLLGAINGAQTGALSGFEAFKTIARVNLLAGLITFPCMLIGTWVWGLEGAISGLVLAQAASCLLNFQALCAEARRSGVPLTWRGAAQEGQVLWNFSVPALASGLVAGPVYWICGVMLINQHNGYAEMGVFAAANQWFGALLFLPGVLGQAALPILSERIGKQDFSRARKVLVFYVKLNALVMIPLIIVVALVSPWVMSSYGESFRGTWPVLVVVLLTAGLVSIQTPVGHVLAASGWMWIGTGMNTVWAVSFISFAYLLDGWGATGLAVSRLIAYCLHSIWVFAFAYSLLRGRNPNSF